MTVKEPIDALTGIRFLFALLVVFLHIDMTTQWLASAPALRNGLVYSGGAGVNFFFILSGFILTYTWFTASSRTKYNFYIARMARIYPVYIVGLVLTAGFVLAHDFNLQFKPETSTEQILSLTSHIALIQAWIPAFVINWNAPGWSLSAEVFFYILFPFVMPLLVRQSAAFLIAIMTGCFFFSMGLPALFHSLGLFNFWEPTNIASLGDHGFITHNNFLYYFPAIRLPDFLTGICLASLFLKHRKFIGHIAPTLLTGGLIGLLIGLQTGPIILPVILINNGVFGPFVCCIILGLSCAENHSLTRLFSSKPMVVLGNASYALYILHIPILFLYIAVLPAGVNPALAAGFYLLLAISASILTYYYFEKPLQTRILKKFSRDGKPV